MSDERSNFLSSIQADQVQSVPETRSGDTHSDEQLLRFAKGIHAARLRRQDFLGAELLGEPGWDMMLALFIAALEQYSLTISNLIAASGVPPTTALRWIEVLHDRGFVSRKPNKLDRRVIFIELETEGRAQMAGLLETAWKYLADLRILE